MIHRPSVRRLFLLLSSLCLLLGPLVRAEEDLTTPIAVKPDSYTAKNYRAQHAAWEQRVFVEAFRAHGHAGKPWDDEAQTFVEKTQALLSGDDEEEASVEAGKPQLAELAERGRRLLAQGCDDPVAVYIAARLAYRETKSWRTPFADYERALKRLEETPAYPRVVAVTVGLALRGIYEQGGYGSRIRPLDEKISGWLRESLDDGSFVKDEDYLFVQQLLGPAGNTWFEARDEDVARWLPGAPLPEWARQTIGGYIEINRAWRSRGAEYAGKVRPEGWQGFEAHLLLARDALTQGWKLRPDRPEAAARMISVVMGNGGAPGDTLRRWFDRATAAQFDYAPAYSYMLWALRPRWNGSYRAMLAFGRLALATKRFDTGVPSQYFRAVDAIASEQDDWQRVYRRSDVAEDVLALSHGLVDAPSRRAEQPLRLSYLAVNAWMSGRDDEAARALATLAGAGGFRPEAAEKLVRFGSDQPTFLSEVALLTGPVKDDYTRADALYQTAKVDPAIAAFEAVAKRISDAQPAAYLVHKRLYALGLERQLAGNGWVKADPGAHLAEWHQASGQWSVVDGVLQNQGADGAGLLILPARVGPNYEVRGRFEFDAQDRASRTLGVVVGYDERKQNGGDWFACTVWQNGSNPAVHASVLNEFRLGGAPRPAVTLAATNTFLVQCWQGHISYYLNDKPVAVDYAHKRNEVVPRAEDGPQLGFGARWFAAKNTTRIHDLEVRRLTASPVPSAAAPAAPSGSPGDADTP